MSHLSLRSLGQTCLALTCAVFLFLAGTAKAQVVSGTIVGTVTDTSGAVVPNATVTATNTGTNISRTTKTDTAGNYTISLLQVGTYTVSITGTGFRGFVASDLSLSASAVLRVNAKLQLGAVTTTVQVSASSIPLLETDTSSVGGTLVSNQVQNIPLNGRNIINLVRTTPGVSEGAPAGLGTGTRPDDRRQSSEISANGQPEYVNNSLIDGVDDNERMIGSVLVKPSVDAIQEVKVYTNMYTARYGRTAGAVVNYITKSGTNQFHGSLYEFVRNDMFNAKDYFNVPQANNPVAGKMPKFKQNQFGGSIGGPIQKNKTFFFGDFEEHRLVQGVTARVRMPSPCELGIQTCSGVTQLGNFSDLLPNTIIYDPVTHNPYPNNIIPLASQTLPSGIQSAVTPLSANYASLFPASEIECLSGPTTCTYTGNPTRTQNASLFDIKIDEHFNSNNTLYARYSWNDTTTFTPGALPPVTVAGIEVQPGENPAGLSFSGPAKERQQNPVVSWTHIFSPSLVGQLTASYQRSTIESLPLNFGKDVNTAFGGPPVNVNGLSTTSGLALVVMSGYGSSGGGGVAGTLGDAQYIPIIQFDNTFQYSGNLTWTRGNHTFTFGLGLIRRQVLLGQSPAPKGVFNFSGLLTNSTEGTKDGTGGNSFAQFLTGYADQMQRRLSLVQSNVRSWEPSGYVEDDWRARPWLTLNLGLRYDIFSPYTSPDGSLSNFDPTIPAVLNGGSQIIAGIGGYGQTAGVKADLTNFQPRIGFAASLPNSTVVRGGFGMTFFPTNYFAGAVLRNPPFASTTTINAEFGQAPGYVPPLFGDSLGPATPTSPCLTDACYQLATGDPNAQLPGSTRADGQAFNYKAAYAYQYSLQVQKAFWGNTATVGYVGSIDRRLRTTGNSDAPLPPAGPGGCGGTYLTNRMTLPNPCQPYYAELPRTNNVATAFTQGVAMYNGLQADLRRTAGHGLTFDTNYTYGRAMSDTSTGAGGTCTAKYGSIPQNRLYDWGNSCLDIRHRWTLTLAYQLPFGNSLTGVAGELVKGWSINTLTIWSSGLPVTVKNNNGQINNGTGSDRPDMVAKLTVPHPSINEWFNTAAFRAQTFGTAGNEANNQIYAPSSKSVGLSLLKSFPIGERASLQFRAEAFNLFNTPTFGEPNANINGFDSNGVPTSAGSFGQILSTSHSFPARELQFALKLLF